GGPQVLRDAWTDDPPAIRTQAPLDGGCDAPVSDLTCTCDRGQVTEVAPARDRIRCRGLPEASQPIAPRRPRRSGCERRSPGHSLQAQRATPDRPTAAWRRL